MNINIFTLFFLPVPVGTELAENKFCINVKILGFAYLEFFADMISVFLEPRIYPPSEENKSD